MGLNKHRRIDDVYFLAQQQQRRGIPEWDKVLVIYDIKFLSTDIKISKGMSSGKPIVYYVKYCFDDIGYML